MLFSPYSSGATGGSADSGGSDWLANLLKNPYMKAGGMALEFLGGQGESEQEKRQNDAMRQQANNMRLSRERSGQLFQENMPRYSNYLNQLENMPSISQQLGAFKQGENWNPNNTMWKK